LAVTGHAAVPVQSLFCAERLANGNTLITDGGSSLASNAKVIEVDSLGRLVWAYVRSDIPWAHTARRLENGHTLITASNGNRVIEVSSAETVVWEMEAGLSYPNEAYRLANGNTLITDRDNDRVIEVDATRTVVWSYSGLTGPHGAMRLASGNTLICDSEGDRVVEIKPDGSLVWQYSTNLSWPRSAERLPSGNTLISDSRHNRVIEVTPAGSVVWSYSSGVVQPLESTRLPSGNTLISNNLNVLEVTPEGLVAWQYPPLNSVVTETLTVVNPSSGSGLYVHIHRPATSGPTTRVPGVILVPDSTDPGTVFDSELADELASDGFAVLHFDADGRGLSQGLDDFCGRVQQDGLNAVALALAARPYADPAKLGIYSRGYGLVMAAGMIARHDLPHVKFLLDFEGPADRFQASSSHGGPVPVPPDSEAFWQEREAARFLKHAGSAYLRIQTATDHTGRLPENEHAIALIDSATSTTHGGSGISVWTRVNDSLLNPANATYSLSNPPNWIPEEEEVHLTCRVLLYLRELADRSFAGVGSASFPVPAASLSVFPNPCHGSTTVRLSSLLAPHSFLSVYDASGRQVQSSFDIRTQSYRLDLGSMPAGVYLLRLNEAGRDAAAKLVVK
jgi:hypothetical protein